MVEMNEEEYLRFAEEIADHIGDGPSPVDCEVHRRIRRSPQEPRNIVNLQDVDVQFR
jgi:hypothetical protein